MDAKWNRRTLGLLGGLAVMMVGGVASAAHEAMDDPNAEASDGVELVAVLGEGDLFPGFAGGDIHVAVVNSSNSALHLTSAVTGKVRSSDELNCPASYVTVKAQTRLDVQATPNATTSTTLVDVVTMLESAPDGCQGVSFTIDLTMTQATTQLTDPA
jgi:hypothetical protein